MIYPNITFAGQKVTICNRYIEQFRQEELAHPSGAAARALRLELNALIPEAYHGHRTIWLHIKWNDVLNGNETLGFLGVDLDKRLVATEKKDELYQTLREFYTYQREISNPTIKRLLHERHKAEQECRQDTTHNPNLSSFRTENGKLILDVPSKNPRNESTNAAFAMRVLELNPGLDEEHRMAVYRALGETKEQTRNSIFWDNKLDKELVRINVNLPEPPDPIEDFTTFTKYTDTSPDPIQTITPTTITAVGVSRNEDTYVYKDKGVDYFDANFLHTFAATMSNNVNVGNGAVWVLTNDIGDAVELINTNKSFTYLLYNNTTNLFLGESDAGTLYFDYITSLTDGQTYYYTLERDESIGSFGQVTCGVHSDSDRTLPVDTLSVLLHANIDFRYVFSLMSYDDNQSTRTLDLTISNLDLGEVGNGVAIIRSRLINLGGNLGGLTKSTLNNLGGI
ncbi:hypothetical protein KAR91_06390 [Candidatus Pacearchaeota archaeon]|nr:hypothetical protein [Candidatus Pacearchaeota archaeon]